MLSPGDRNHMVKQGQQDHSNSSSADDQGARAGFAGWCWLPGEKDRTPHPSTVPIEGRGCATDQAASRHKQEHLIKVGAKEQSPYLVSNSATKAEPEKELQPPREPFHAKVYPLALEVLVDLTSCTIFAHAMSTACCAQRSPSATAAGEPSSDEAGEQQISSNSRKQKGWRLLAAGSGFGFSIGQELHFTASGRGRSGAACWSPAPR